MALFPLLSRNWWDTWDNPSKLLDQHFGMGLLDSDLLPPTLHRGYLLRPRTQGNIDSSGHSEVTNAQDKFKVMLNVSQFRLDEIQVKTVDNAVVIHGKHEEKSDEHGFVSREFTRRYMLPEGTTEPESVKSSLTPDNVLVVEASKKAIEPPPTNERVVPISMNKPAVEGN